MKKNKVVRFVGWGIFCLIFLWQGCRNGASNAQKQLQKAEELYALGTSSNQHSNYEESTTYLKQAEECLVESRKSKDERIATRSNQLLGLTRFHLGNTSESEMLYEIAGSYYHKAIPLLMQGENAVYLACAYRDIARTMALTGGEQDSVLWYFAQAKQYAQTAQSDVLLLDIDAYRYQLCYPDSVTQRLAVCKELAEKHGVKFTFGTEQEFYLFLLDENGKSTAIPCDDAGYMDIAPEDRGENVRRETCLTLEEMGISTESSFHEEGPGQNEIDIPFAGALAAADNALTFQRVVKTVANRNGLAADFSPKPLADFPGNGFHINMSLYPFDEETFSHMIAGVLANIKPMTLFLNPSENSYLRLGQHKAPAYVSWSAENRSQLVRIPAAAGEYRRMELRSPDPAEAFKEQIIIKGFRISRDHQAYLKSLNIRYDLYTDRIIISVASGALEGFTV